MLPLALMGLVTAAPSNQGHWFGEQPAAITLTWTTPAAAHAAVVEWVLMLGDTALASGRGALRPPPEACRIEITPPDVRVRTRLTCCYRVVDAGTAVPRAAGAVAIWVYPDDLLAGLAARLRGREVVVCDSGEALSALLDDARIAHRRSASPLAAPMQRPDVVLVAPDQIEDSPLGQSALLRLAAAGAQVMIFRQSKPARLAGYRLAPGPRSSSWAIPSPEHPLLVDLGVDDVHRWCDGGAPEPIVVELPRDEAALDLVIRAQSGPATMGAVDALLAVKHVGSGRLVLCQVPVDWRHDPRSRLLLRNALVYLTTPPGPTPPPSQRDKTPAAATDPQIQIPSGAQP